MEQENENNIQQYYYPGTDVYINKIGIKNNNQLSKLEYKFVVAKMSCIDDMPKDTRHNLEQWKSIHKFIFGDLYEWAGELRKNIVFDDFDSPLSSPAKIEEGFSNIVCPLLEKTNHFNKSDDKSIVKDLSELMGELYYIHPFRDGNTRSLIQFARSIAQDAGFSIDFSGFDVEQWKALQDGIVRAAFDRNTDILENVLSGCISYDASLIEHNKHLEFKNEYSSNNVADDYNARFKSHVEVKKVQALNLMRKLEASVTSQKTLVADTLGKRPGWMMSLWKGKAWAETLKHEQIRLNTLEERLTQVRGIRAAMGGKRLEELARKKLQRTDPALVLRRDAEERLRREQQADESLRLARERQQAQTQGRGRTLTRDV